MTPDRWPRVNRRKQVGSLSGEGTGAAVSVGGRRRICAWGGGRACREGTVSQALVVADSGVSYRVAVAYRARDLHSPSDGR